MLKITIDGKLIQIQEGYTLIQACEMAGIEIPRFCYHERLKIAGNCRMCLVEIENAPKLVASCAMPVADGMVVHTNTPKVEKARHGVMEFLLINHPLDCPICDQGGECDLQDQAFKYGRNISQFHEHKRAVTDKYMGPLVKTQMTRCIHCTRCIRFATDIAGVDELGTIGRGEHMEISTYLNKTITSELSGNLVDICPVGALTSKPYEFKYRSWELEHTYSIDVFDAVGSNIRIDSKGMEIVRILPQINDDINQEWLSDKGRFSCDGLKYQRLDRPYAKIHGKLQEVSWQKALDIFKFQMGNLDSHQLAAIPGSMLDCESIFGFKELLRSLGFSNIAKNQFNHQFDVTSRANYLFNTGIAGIDQADFCLIVGANPRHNATVLNARIGSNVRAGKLYVASLGYADDQTYKIDELGQDLEVLNQILAGQHRLSQQLALSVKPMMIIGDGIYSRAPDAMAIKSLLKLICEKYGFIKEDWNGFNVLHNDAGSVGLLDLGFGDGCDVKEIFHAAGQGEIKLVYLLDADEFDMSQLGRAFVVYQGHHGDKGASRADLILPATAYTERDGIYVNTEGRPQYSRAALARLLHAKDNTQIFIDIAKSMNLQLLFNHPSQVRSKMLEKYPHLMPDDNYRFSVNGQLNFAVKAYVNVIGEKLSKIENNYYMNNVISRASPTMLDCAKFILGLNK